MKPGDIFTVEGIYAFIPNYDRRWWQFWKPKRIRTKRLQEFKVHSIRPPLSTRVWSSEKFYDAMRHADFHAGAGR